MKLSKIKQIISELVEEELKEGYTGHPEWDDEQGDGYSNDHQRAFAHSQATTPRANETKKAQELAKQGKYVVLVSSPVYCKTTDACLGDTTTIEHVFPTREEAEKYAEKFHSAEHSDDMVQIIGPEDLEPKKSITKPSPEDDIPFEEGVGYVSDKDMKKDPKHIKGDRWKIKFQSDRDLKKHGNTEMSPVNETISKRYLKSVIKEIISEMWMSKDNAAVDTYTKNVDEGDKKQPVVINIVDKVKNKGGSEPQFEGVQPIHSISKPVRIPQTNEWVVKWMTNGKRDENKTYYTDDKQDAFDTYKIMVKHAEEENRGKYEGVMLPPFKGSHAKNISSKPAPLRIKGQ